LPRIVTLHWRLTLAEFVDMASTAATGSGKKPHAYADAREVEAFVAQLLGRYGVPAADCEVVARCLVRADLRGIETHGIARLPVYVDRIERKLVNPAPDLVAQRVAPMAAIVDGKDGLGFVCATRAMTEAIAMAKEMGIGVAAVRRSTHFGMAANYVLQALEAGLVSLVFSNASKAMPPWGGRVALLGTSPLAAGAPGGGKGDVVLDMAPSVAARGKLRRAVARGESIPLGYALDAEGRPTTDPAEGLKGVVLPMGGPKGSGIALLMDIFGGVISGAAFGGDVGNQYLDFDRPQNVGHFLLAMKPDLFISRDEYESRMDSLVDRVRSCPTAEGFDEVMVPGEPEARKEALRLREGIPYNPAELGDLRKLAETQGVGLFRVSNVPLEKD
jgi:LDH2 family malate/lactate/ureidoglycolate dehydrogenase